MKRNIFSPARGCLLAIALGCTLLIHAAESLESGIKPVSIEALVMEALANNPELKFYEAEIVVARAGLKSAGQLANPEFTATLGHKSVNGPGGASEGVAWSAAILQPFEWPGRIGLRKAIANRDVELAELGLARFRTALTGKVRALAFSLSVAEERARAAQEVAERFRALREVLVQRDPAGLTPLLETRVIEATELTAHHKAGEATLAIQSSLLELNQLRGVLPDAPLSVAATELQFQPASSMDSLVALARTNNFELRVRLAELEQQGLKVDLARLERRPGISAGPMISEERAGDRERIIGVGISVPLPLWNRNAGNIETAKARQLQAEVSLAVAERELRRNLASAALTYAARLREMNTWRSDAAQHFQQAAELADRHYRLGAVQVSTYVELQKQYLEAVEALLDTKKGALEAAQQLELLTGLSLPLVQITEAKK